MGRRLWAGIGFATLAAFGPSGAQAEAPVLKQYDDGGFYEGSFLNGKQHGQGRYRLPNGYDYEGEWVAGEISGTGRAKFPDGSVYEGQFVRGLPEGRGRIT
ncbi:2-isopropylmalate synthase, partial [Candidatus Falkowbacteria bacterium]|nr:2-isopropylmalate synthase [Candidatus Falkowbacteria bacterium]